MPDHSHPGVFVEELPGGPHPIGAVGTSTCAFVGRAARGPTGIPVSVGSHAEFERVFGGLWNGGRLGFAVRDFFLNGGRTAVVVRLHRDESGAGARPGRASLALDTLVLEAVNPGAWGNALKATVDHVAAPAPEPGDGDTGTSVFALTVRDGTTGATEEHRDVVVHPPDHPRHVSTVLESQSQLVRALSWGPERPAAVSAGVSGSGLASDGEPLRSEDLIGVGNDTAHRGLYALRDADFALLVIPPYAPDDSVDPGVVTAAAALCGERRAMLLLDPPPGWTDVAAVTAAYATGFDLALGTVSRDAAVFFPRAMQPNPLNGNVVEEFGVAGAVAGVMARNDDQRGVWKAAAGIGATLVGVPDLALHLTDHDIGRLNPIGVNSLRALPGSGHVVWGARTLEGSEARASEWKYVPVRRTALMIEESIARGTAWAVFEPNAEPLWARIRADVGAFLDGLFRRGAFEGVSPRDAYFVTCDASTTTQSDIDRGVLTLVVGFAPLKPAEFVVVHLHVAAGQPTR